MNSDLGRELAGTLRKIRDDVLKRVSDGRPVWYQGGENYFDVFFEIDDDGENLWFQFTRGGKAVTWNRSTGRVWTGNTNELTVSSPPHSAAKIIDEDPQYDRGTVAHFAEIMAHRKETEFKQAVSVLHARLNQT